MPGVFRNRIKDLITYVVTDPNTFAGENRNVERASIRGLELAYRFEGRRLAIPDQRSLFQDPKDQGQ